VLALACLGLICWSLGLLRPYMLDVDKNGQRTSVKYESADSILFLDHNVIYGGPGFGDGWGDLKVTPGLYLKPAVRFDYGRYNEVVSAIEVGPENFIAKKFLKWFTKSKSNFSFRLMWL